MPSTPSAQDLVLKRSAFPKGTPQTQLGGGLGKLSAEWKGEASDPTLNFSGKEVRSMRKYRESGLPQALQGTAWGAINQRGKEAGRWEDGWAWGALTRKVCFLGMTTF